MKINLSHPFPTQVPDIKLSHAGNIYTMKSATITHWGSHPLPHPKNLLTHHWQGAFQFSLVQLLSRVRRFATS